jgi:uncharacterized protein (DUF362 family)
MGGSMSRKIDRREFIKTTTTVGLSVAVGKGLIAEAAENPLGTAAADKIGVAVAAGSDYEKATIVAVKLLGGIEKYIPSGAKVALLPNVQSRHPGAFTKPEVLRGAVKLCKQAKASAVDCLSWLTMKHWEAAGLKAVIDAEGIGLKLIEKDESLFKPVKVPGAKALPEARIMNAFFEYDVFINIPVTKDHAGNKFTGTMKNLMGLNSPVNNRTFHKPNWKTDPDEIAHLDQCIVDLNKAAKPALNIVDATEIITTNGPFGPGELLKPQKVVAGTDRVAVDAYCTGLWGLRPEDIIMIKRGAEQGLGTMDLKKAGVKEIKV